MSLLSARGCVYKTSIGPGSSRGAILLRPGLSSGGQYPILLTGATTSQDDILMAMPCMENFKVVYVFGQAMGNVMVLGEILLGPIYTGGSSTGIWTLRQWFDANRASTRRKAIDVSLGPGAGSFRFLLQGLSLGQQDLERHIQPFALRGILIDKAGADGLGSSPAMESGGGAGQSGGGGQTGGGGIDNTPGGSNNN